METLSLNIIGNLNNSEDVFFIDEFTRCVALALKQIEEKSRIVYISDLNGDCEFDLINIVELFSDQKKMPGPYCIIASVEATELLFYDRKDYDYKAYNESYLNEKISDYLKYYFEYITNLGFINIDKSLYSDTSSDSNTLYFVYTNEIGNKLINFFRLNKSKVINGIVDSSKIKDNQIQCNLSNAKNEDEESDEICEEDDITEETKCYHPKVETTWVDETQNMESNNHPFNAGFSTLVDSFISEEKYQGDN